MTDETTIHLSQDDAQMLCDLLENPPEPNENLKRAMALYKELISDEIIEGYREFLQTPAGLKTREAMNREGQSITATEIAIRDSLRISALRSEEENDEGFKSSE